MSIIELLTRSSGFDDIMVEYFYAFNISTLIATSNTHHYLILHLISCLMLNIKTQMDEFIAKPYLFLDYETLGIDTLSASQMDYYYNLYESYKNGNDPTLAMQENIEELEVKVSNNIQQINELEVSVRNAVTPGSTATVSGEDVIHLNTALVANEPVNVLVEGLLLTTVINRWGF